MGRVDETRARAAGRVLLRLVEEEGPLETPCWIWPGARSGSGYGYVHVGGREGRVELVHVLLFRVLAGVVRRGRLVHHRCERKLCANPDHLEALTRRQHALRHRRALAPCGHPYDMAMGRGRARACRRCRNAGRRARYREALGG